MADWFTALWSDRSAVAVIGFVGVLLLLGLYLAFLDRIDARRIEAARAQEHRGPTVRPVPGRLPRTDYQAHFGTEDRHLTEVDAWLVSRDPVVGQDQISAKARMRRHR